MSKVTKSRIFTCCNFLIFLLLLIILSYIFGYLQVYVVQIETEGFQGVTKKNWSSNSFIYIGMIIGICFLFWGLQKFIVQNIFND